MFYPKKENHPEFNFANCLKTRRKDSFAAGTCVRPWADEHNEPLMTTPQPHVRDARRHSCFLHPDRREKRNPAAPRLQVVRNKRRHPGGARARRRWRHQNNSILRCHLRQLRGLHIGRGGWACSVMTAWGRGKKKRTPICWEVVLKIRQVILSPKKFRKCKQTKKRKTN